MLTRVQSHLGPHTRRSSPQDLQSLRVHQLCRKQQRIESSLTPRDTKSQVRRLCQVPQTRQHRNLVTRRRGYCRDRTVPRPRPQILSRPLDHRCHRSRAGLASPSQRRFAGESRRFRPGLLPEEREVRQDRQADTPQACVSRVFVTLPLPTPRPPQLTSTIMQIPQWPTVELR